MADLYPSLDAILSWTADRAPIAWSLDAIDKAIAAHDAKVKAEALREAGARMDDISQKIGFETPADAVRAMKQIVRRMADRIEADS